MSSIKTLNLYEQVGIVFPGSTVIFGLFFVSPEIKAIFVREGFSIGDFGLFVTVSYVAGHLVAAVGNCLEWVYWKPWGGMPSTWIVKPGERLISDIQIEKLEGRLATRLKLNSSSVRNMSPKTWQHIFMQVTADVRANGADERAEIFNGNYGLNRGIASAVLVVAITNLFLNPSAWMTTAIFMVLFGLALIRMHRFGVYYARTMLREFLQLPEMETTGSHSE
ncbi:hypothetical protein P7L75_00855 (plasmid) [Tistrella mobilis]|uniref:hypothetical protein n=1 Tax=Tistrella mobilis TaxID=171437 RepID=UPI0035569152